MSPAEASTNSISLTDDWRLSGSTPSPWRPSTASTHLSAALPTKASRPMAIWVSAASTSAAVTGGTAPRSIDVAPFAEILAMASWIRAS